ncbi:MAG: hypothetical protein DRJ26_04785 [Candidatus Methanomethylicota archaeon]|uniref:UPF0033 domain-containing protein n=1 Tax=Thermoproteota archaeon TaxID=2056631 RepID=A0A497EYH1_9CREN|nr:MAG: hypothetical protein DRJ26_04785 [Candidatus Verstraetearchaeota archaeon]
MRADIVVDARYKSCPGPLIMLFETVKGATSRAFIELLATDPDAVSDVKEWVEAVGHEFLRVDVESDVYAIYVKIR